MRQSPFQHGPEGSQSILPKHSILVDTDIGDDIDDALALALILRSPEIDLRGITTVFGDTQRRARLAQHLLHVYDREDVPVAAGVRTPLQPRHRPSGVPQAAIIDSRAVTPAVSTLSGSELIVETALALRGDLTILCLGPLTNIATALRIQPDLFMTISEIIMVGGTSGLPFPEWNVRSDAKAAQIVLGAGIPVKLLGWNITTRCQLRGCDLQRLRSEYSPETQLLSQLLEVWKRHHNRWQPDLPYIHDTLTVAALCAPELFEFEEMTARVFTHGPLTGFMVPRIMNGPLVQAAIGLKAEMAREWVMTRLITSSHMQTS